MQGRRGETGGQSGLYGIIRKTGGGEKERGEDKVWAVWDKWQGGWGERTKSGLKGKGLKGVREREKGQSGLYGGRGERGTERGAVWNNSARREGRGRVGQRLVWAEWNKSEGEWDRERGVKSGQYGISSKTGWWVCMWVREREGVRERESGLYEITIKAQRERERERETKTETEVKVIALRRVRQQ